MARFQNTTRLQLLRFGALAVLFAIFWFFFLPRGQASISAKSVVVATSGVVLGCSAAALWLWRAPLSWRVVAVVVFLALVGPAQNLIIRHYNERATFWLFGAWAYVFVGVGFFVGVAELAARALVHLVHGD